MGETCLTHLKIYFMLYVFNTWYLLESILDNWCALYIPISLASLRFPFGGNNSQNNVRQNQVRLGLICPSVLRNAFWLTSLLKCFWVTSFTLTLFWVTSFWETSFWVTSFWITSFWVASFWVIHFNCLHPPQVVGPVREAGLGVDGGVGAGGAVRPAVVGADDADVTCNVMHAILFAELELFHRKWTKRRTKSSWSFAADKNDATVCPESFLHGHFELKSKVLLKYSNPKLNTS